MKHHYFNFRQLTIYFSRRPTLHRHDSIISLYANSIYSKAPSSTHMLAHVNPGNSSSVAVLDSTGPSYMMSENNTSNLSLSVNYIPSKFSRFRNRKSGKYYSVHGLPKDGGGLQAFKTNEARMPQEGKGKLKWNKFKWVLFVTNSLVCFFSFTPLLPIPFYSNHNSTCSIPSLPLSSVS